MNILNQSSQPQLLCYCNHCPNNTCIAEQYGTCMAESRLEQDGQFTEKFYCYNQNLPDDLIRRIVCNTNLSKTSNSLYRCCNSHNFCNRAKDFLTNIEEVKRDFLIASDDSQTSNNSTGSHQEVYDHFSNLPLEIKLALVVVAGILLILLLALIQKLISRARGLSQHSDSQSYSSSNKNSSDSPPQDTNSLLSKDPLLSTSSCTEQIHQPLYNHCNFPGQITTANSPVHPNPLSGPWMSEEKYLGRTHSTIVVSIGSAEPHRSKQDTSTGSGQGHAYLHQRSIINDIELRAVIGRGRYGVVYRGDYKGERVAVKIFLDSSWERESEIYQTSLLRHKNILGFIASDLKTEGTFSGFWIVTDYHHHGSLSDFMKNNTLVLPDAIRFAFSIANGLAHMHTEIYGTQGKPAIAHRDIKSKNILVKNDGTCCIADLGMAARFNSKTNLVDLPTNPRLGTIRYLAPEILDNKLNLMDFEAIKATDMYSLGLVFWEILRRTVYKYKSLDDMPELSFPSSRHLRPCPKKPAPVSPPLVLAPAPVSLPKLPTHDPDNETQPPPFTSDPKIPIILVDGQLPGCSTSVFQTEIEKHFEMLKKKKEEGSLEDLPELSGLPSTHESDPEKPMNIETNLLDSTSSESGQKIDDDIDTESISKAGNSIIYEDKMVESSISLDYTNITLESSPEVSTANSLSNISFECEPLSPPYDEYASPQPTMAEMREIVCVRKLRPSIMDRWNKFVPMRDFVTVIKECWYEKPQARLSALRTRKTLGDIAKFYFNLHSL